MFLRGRQNLDDESNQGGICVLGFRAIELELKLSLACT
jgi:hypothetical protein